MTTHTTPASTDHAAALTALYASRDANAAERIAKATGRRDGPHAPDTGSPSPEIAVAADALWQCRRAAERARWRRMGTPPDAREGMAA